jgi:hypothetical protein
MALFNRSSSTGDRSKDERDRTSSRSSIGAFFGSFRLGGTSSSNKPLPGQIMTGFSSNNKEAEEDSSASASTTGDAPNASNTGLGFRSLFGRSSLSSDTTNRGRDSDVTTTTSESSSSLASKGGDNQNSTNNTHISDHDKISSSTDVDNRNSSSSLNSNDNSNNSRISDVPRKSYHENQFELLMSTENIDMTQLRSLSWQGIPSKYR